MDSATTRSRAPRVLVTGASIAGPALAWGLHKAGFQVQILERSPGQREAGQNIDIRGLGREVLRRMGIEDQVRDNLTGEEGTRYVDQAGRAYAQIPREEGQDGPTAELEILRGAFAELLVKLVPAEVPIRYGDFITAVQQDDSGVDVTLDGGAQERYDLVLVAEGRSSRTRRLLFADETEYRDHGVSIATAPSSASSPTRTGGTGTPPPAAGWRRCGPTTSEPSGPACLSSPSRWGSRACRWSRS